MEGFSKNAVRLLETKNKFQGKPSHFTAMKDLYNSQSNPNGYISLGIAENTLSYDVLKEKLALSTPKQKLTQYSEMGGIQECRELIASLLQDHIFKFRPTNNELLVKPNEILLSSGATSLVENLFQMFCDSGEICIIPSPFYPSFVQDASLRFGVKVVAAETEIFDKEDHSENILDFKLDLEVFERIYNTPGNTVKMVLLCNPNNPNGWIFPENEVKALIGWCREKKIHFVSDEIYALSIFNQEFELTVDQEEKKKSEAQQVKTHEFKSSYDICQGDMGEYVHILNGFSKDFCLNGFRAGYFYSQNPLVFRYMTSTSMFYACSNIVQSTLINVLKDKLFLGNFIKENQNRLCEAYNFAANTLREFGIPFVKSSSGLFLSIDLRAALPIANTDDDDDKFSEEIKLWDSLNENRVLVNPGKFCYHATPGFFRLVFSLPKEFVYQGIKRISIVYNNSLSQLKK